MASSSKTPNINLLSMYVDSKRRHKAKGRRIQSFSVLILVSYLAILSTLIVSKALIAAKLHKVESEISKEKLHIAQLEQVEKLQLLVKNKVEIVTSLIDFTPLREHFGTIRSYLPEGVVLETIAIGEQQDTIEITMTAEDVFALNPLLDEFESYIDQSLYKQVFLDSISRTDDGIYSLRGQITTK